MKTAGTKIIAAVLPAMLAHSMPAGAELMRFGVDAGESEVSAAVKEPMGAIRRNAVGTFRITSGEVVVDSANPSRSTEVRLVIDAASYSSGSAMRDRSVTGSILEASAYPTIEFKGADVDNIVRTGESSGTATINGSLTLHGVTRQIFAPVSVQLADDRLLTEGEVTIDYPKWGIAVPTLMFGAMRAGEQATIHYRIVARREPPGRP